MLAFARPIRLARTLPVSPVLRQLHSAPSTLAQCKSQLSRDGVTASARSSCSPRFPPLPDHFDTADYVTRLESHGLSRSQAEGVIDTLEEIIGESIQTMQGNLVTRAEQDKVSGLGILWYIAGKER